MLTATFPPSLLTRLQVEIEADRHNERCDALEQLATIQQQLNACVPTLDSVVVTAVAALDAAKIQAAALVSAAESHLADARGDRGRKVGPLEHQRDTLTSRLETDLQHPAIPAALTEISDAVAETRTSDDHSHSSAVAAWALVARQQLADLRYSSDPPAEIQLAVDALLAGRP